MTRETQVRPQARASRALDPVLRVAGVPAAALLAIGGQLLIARQTLLPWRGVYPGVALYVAAAALMIATWRRAAPDGGRRAGSAALPAGAAWGLVALLAFGALHLRLYQIDLIPPGLNNDEAINALEADAILHGKPFASLTTVGLHRETMFHRLAALAYGNPGLGLNLLRAMPAVFGLQPNLLSETPLMDLVFPLRGVAIVAGVLTVLALYLFARDRFGGRVAILAAILLAVSPWHLLYSRVGLRAILAPLFAVAAAGLFLKALEAGRPALHLAWGAVVGLGFWTFTSFRAVPLAFLLYVLVRRFVEPGAPRLRGTLSRSMLAGVAVAAAFLALLMAFSPIGALGFLTRGAYATLVTPRADFLRNLWTSATMIHHFPSRYAVIQSDAFISDGVSAAYGLIGLEPEVPIVAALAALGLLVAGGRAAAARRGADERRAGAACALVLLLYATLILTVGLAGPSLTRMLMNVPWIALFAALTLDAAWRSLARIRPPLGAWIGGALVAAALATAAAQGCAQYFRRAGRSPEAMQHFGPTQTIMAMFVRSLPRGAPVYVLHTLRVDSLRYLVGDRPDLYLVSDPTHLDLDSIIRMPRTAVLVVEYARPFAEALRYLIMRFPQGDMTQVADARFDPDKPVFFTFTLWKDASGQPMAPAAGAPEPGPPSR